MVRPDCMEIVHRDRMSDNTYIISMEDEDANHWAPIRCRWVPSICEISLNLIRFETCLEALSVELISSPSNLQTDRTAKQSTAIWDNDNYLYPVIWPAWHTQNRSKCVSQRKTEWGSSQNQGIKSEENIATCTFGIVSNTLHECVVLGTVF